MDDALVATAAALTGIVYLRMGIAARAKGASQAAPAGGVDEGERGRIRRADDERERVTALPRYSVAIVGFGTACALLAHIIPATVAYAVVCLAIAARCVADLFSEENAPRRRSALLGRSRSLDPMLLTWIGLAAVSSLMLLPWILDESSRAAAILVTLCVATMVAVAWRIASAPPLLFGNDLEAEYVVDREMRAVRTGNTCMITVGAVGVFVAFVGGSPSGVHYRADIVYGTLAVWLGLFVWRWLYTRHLSGMPLAL